jgi:hypothetical protein
MGPVGNFRTAVFGWSLSTGSFDWFRSFFPGGFIMLFAASQNITSPGADIFLLNRL